MFAYRSARTELMTIAHQDDTYDRLYTETVLQKLSAARHPLIAFTDYGELRNGAIVNKIRFKGKTYNVASVAPEDIS